MKKTKEKMKKYLRCFRGETSNQSEEEEEEEEQQQQQSTPPFSPPVQQQSEPLNPFERTDSSETMGSEEYYLHSLFGNYTGYTSSPDANPDHGQLLPPPQLPNPGVTFPWHEILDGTENLRHTNFLGGGNFGEVYRCDFPIRDMVGAAKIQNLDNPISHAEFDAEVTTLERANHPNVIQLLGKCLDPGTRVIVYEFMPRGSLEHNLCVSGRPIPALIQGAPGLNWERRMLIAVGVAEALLYVHDVLRMVHRDVKIGNVLLDHDFLPKLTDFGLAVPILEDINGNEIQNDVYPIKGTPGCIAPETEQSGLVSTKSDVYSFGVFLYQLFTGKEAYDTCRRPDIMEITDWLRLPIWSQEVNFPKLVDPALGNRFSVEGLNRLFLIAGMCIEEQPNHRPHMGFVELMVRQSADYMVPEMFDLPERHSL